jgi:hypothetical protein
MLGSEISGDDGGSELDGNGNGIGGKRGCRVGQARKFIGMPGARGDSGGASQDVVVAVEVGHRRATRCLEPIHGPWF